MWLYEVHLDGVLITVSHSFLFAILFIKRDQQEKGAADSLLVAVILHRCKLDVGRPL